MNALHSEGPGCVNKCGDVIDVNRLIGTHFARAQSFSEDERVRLAGASHARIGPPSLGKMLKELVRGLEMRHMDRVRVREQPEGKGFLERTEE